jgi:hypothetical protein
VLTRTARSIQCNAVWLHRALGFAPANVAVARGLEEGRHRQHPRSARAGREARPLRNSNGRLARGFSGNLNSSTFPCRKSTPPSPSELPQRACSGHGRLARAPGFRQLEFADSSSPHILEHDVVDRAAARRTEAARLDLPFVKSSERRRRRHRDRRKRRYGLLRVACPVQSPESSRSSAPSPRRSLNRTCGT